MEVWLYRTTIAVFALMIGILAAALCSPNAYGLEPFWENFGSLFVSLAAFLFAYVVALLATRAAMDMQRRTKLADFRQAWVNEFRNDVANLISFSDPLTVEDSEVKEKLQNKNSAVARLLLRLNPNGNLENEIRDTIAAITRSKTGDDFIIQANRLTKQVNRYLKSEWDIIKQELEVSP